MKNIYRLFTLFCVILIAAIVWNAQSPSEAFHGTLAVAGLFGYVSIAKDTDTAGVVVFDTILEDWVGGAVLNRARLKTGTTEIKAGTPLYISDGAAEIIKTAAVITGGNTTGIRVGKNHQFIVGEFVMYTENGAAMEITAITTSNANYDVITIGTTLGASLTTGHILLEAAAQADSNASPKYTANAILKTTVNVENANPTCSGVVRGSVREAALPYSVHALDVAALNLFRFV